MWNVFGSFPMFDRAFDDVMRTALGAAATGQPYAPAIDVRADGEKVVFHCDLPGVRREDLSVTLENGVLTVRGERKYRAGPENERVWLGRCYGAFARSFTLPEGLNEQGLSAELADGVLTISVPKLPKATPRRIEIRSAAAPKRLESGSGGGGPEGQGSGES